MSKLHQHPLFMLSVGVVLGCAVMTLKSPPSLTAATSHGNDKFSMCTVNVTLGEAEAVFALDHLTGVLRGGYLNNQTGTFTHGYLRNVAADFQVNPATPEPKYAIVSGTAQMRGSGGTQPANGILYIGELTSGAVVAYTFAMPRGRGCGAYRNHQAGRIPVPGSYWGIDDPGKSEMPRAVSGDIEDRANEKVGTANVPTFFVVRQGLSNLLFDFSVKQAVHGEGPALGAI